LILLLRPDAAPFRVILVAGLQAGIAPLRWSIATGASEPSGIGRDDAPIAAAVDALAEVALQRESITVRSGDPAGDALLGDLAPALAALLAGLTERQREAGRLLLIDGLRRSEIAAALGISRPTVSVMVDRARLLEIARFARGLDAILADRSGRVVNEA
jgi:DNA-binding CsgD family transcriptional regulator